MIGRTNACVISGSTDEDYAPEIPLDEWSDWGVNTYKLNSVGSTEDYTYYQISYKEYPFAVGDTITLYGLRSEDANYGSRHVVEGTFEDDQTVSSSGIKVLEFLADETVYFKIYTGYHYDNGSVVLDSAGEHNIVLEVDHSYIRYEGFIAFDYPRTTYLFDPSVGSDTVGIRYVYVNDEYQEVTLPEDYEEGIIYFRIAPTKKWQFDSKNSKYGNFVQIQSGSENDVAIYKLVLSVTEYPENYLSDLSCLCYSLNGNKVVSCLSNHTNDINDMGFDLEESYQQVLMEYTTNILIGFDWDVLSGNPESFVEDIYKDGLLVRYPITIYYVDDPASIVDPADIDVKLDFKPYHIGDINLEYTTNQNMTFDSIGYYAENLNDVMSFDDFKLSVYSVYDNKKKQDNLSIINDNEYGLCAKTDKYVIQFNKSIQNGSLISDNSSLAVQLFDSNINYLSFDFTSRYLYFVHDKELKHKSVVLRTSQSYSESNYPTYHHAGNVGEISHGYNIPYVNYVNNTNYVSYLYYGYDDTNYVKSFTFSNGIAIIYSPHTNEKMIEVQVNKVIDANGVITDQLNNTLYLYYTISNYNYRPEKAYFEDTSNYEIDTRTGYEYYDSQKNEFVIDGDTIYSDESLLNIRELFDSTFNIQDLIGRSFNVHCIYSDYTTGTQNLTFAQSSTITDGEGNYAIEAVGDGIKIVYMGRLDNSQTGYIYYKERVVDTDYDNPNAYIYPGVVAIDTQTEYDGKILSHIAFNTTDYGVTNYFS